MVHAGGRPSKYDPKYIQEVDTYLESRTDKVFEFHKTRGKTNSYDRHIKVQLPTVEGFAQFIGVDKTTLYEWEQVHPEFSHTLEKIKTEQHNRLIDKGLSGDYSPVIAKLILSANHGYKEKTDITTDGKPVNISFDDAFTSKAETDSK